MGNPPDDRRRDGAAKPGRGQVQHGNTLPITGQKPAAVLFMAADAP
jgi:hypothetical protein